MSALALVLYMLVYYLHLSTNTGLFFFFFNLFLGFIFFGGLFLSLFPHFLTNHTDENYI
jgi:high-affinity Fe2+/Pb2+ permease